MTKLIVGPGIDKGQKTDRTAFNIDNDSFPQLTNAYQWRGRIKRKRGTEFLSRLNRAFPDASIGNSGASPWTINTIYSTYVPPITPETNASINPKTVTITIHAGPDIVFTDQGDGTLTSPTAGNSGTINYLTGVIVLTHTAGAGIATTAHFTYFPALPVLGLEDLVLPQFQFPNTLAFDQTYSYHMLNVVPNGNYNISYYKNPAADPTNLPGYVPKTTWTQTTWNGENYQQFYTVNYQGALWATNGVRNPFIGASSKISMQFSAITNVAAPIGNTVVITVTGANLVVGDFVFLNEFDPGFITGINFQTGYVIAGAAPGAITIELPNATLAGAGGATAKGIVQYLTNRSDTTKDCLRWFDGDPVSSSLTNPVFLNGSGWVNFAPPLSNGIYSIADLPAAQYYLVGAKVIFPFKDRLIFFGPVIQTSTGNPIYLPDALIWSQNGTPYYTVSFTGDPTLTTTTYSAILVPPNQTATPNAYWEDFTGYGGFLTAGISQTINTVAPNEDALIVGFTNLQARLFYTGNDLLPFSLFIINSELGSSSTFSAIVMDQGVLSRGDRGFIVTSQTQCQRLDLDIPDQVFESDLFNNGTERICAARDFINEWVYFTYSSNSDDSSTIYPDQTLQYNYRDQSWALFKETYTSYGPFKRQNGFIWGTVGNSYPTWEDWNDPWNAGESTALQPNIIAGNQQGFICIRGKGTGEGQSLYIKNFSSSLVTSPDHGLEVGDYIIINGVLGTIGSQVNGKVFSINTVTKDTFTINPGITSGTYIGAGTITRIYVPYIQTKQFPLAWDIGRKIRLGVQQYLLSTTNNSQIQLLIFLSQDAANAYNDPTQVVNDSLIYTTTLYTCPESTNLGLTAANINLQMIGSAQEQIWHRINTSLIGDTVQLGFTLSDAQIRALNSNNQPINAFAEVELHAFIIDVTPSQVLA